MKATSYLLATAMLVSTSLANAQTATPIVNPTPHVQQSAGTTPTLAAEPAANASPAEAAAPIAPTPTAAPDPYGRGIPVNQLNCEQVIARYALWRQTYEAKDPPKKPLGQRMLAGAGRGLFSAAVGAVKTTAVIGASVATIGAGSIGGGMVQGAFDGAEGQQGESYESLARMNGNLMSAYESLRALNTQAMNLGCDIPANVMPR